MRIALVVAALSTTALVHHGSRREVLTHRATARATAPTTAHEAQRPQEASAAHNGAEAKEVSTPPRSTARVVRGIVVDDRDVPIEGAQVRFVDLRKHSGCFRSPMRTVVYATATTARSGRFCLDKPLPSESAVSVRAHFAVWATGHSRCRVSRNGPMRIVLPRLASARIRVMLPDGRPAEGAVVRITPGTWWASDILPPKRLGPDGCWTGDYLCTRDSLWLSVTLDRKGDPVRYTARPIHLSKSLRPGALRDIAIWLEEIHTARLEVVVYGVHSEIDVEIDYGSGVPVKRGFASTTIETGSHRIKLRGEHGVCAERVIHVEPTTTVERLVFDLSD